MKAQRRAADSELHGVNIHAMVEYVRSSWSIEQVWSLPGRTAVFWLLKEKPDVQLEAYIHFVFINFHEIYLSIFINLLKFFKMINDTLQCVASSGSAVDNFSINASRY